MGWGSLHSCIQQAEEGDRPDCARLQNRLFGCKIKTMKKLKGHKLRLVMISLDSSDEAKKQSSPPIWFLLFGVWSTSCAQCKVTPSRLRLRAQRCTHRHTHKGCGLTSTAGLACTISKEVFRSHRGAMGARTGR